MAHLAIEDLTFSYPSAAAPTLRGVNLEIPFGSYVCLCGPTGCGKTTLLRHLKSALTPHGETSGRVLVDGRPLIELSDRDQSALIGFVMQNPDAQIVTDKVWHELAFGLECLGVDQPTMRLRVAEMASYFAIENWFHKEVRDLSGGQKQLLNLASVMALQPSILVLDEPTSQLDPVAAADFLNTVRKINLDLGTTIIISEHRLDEVFATADEVAVMEAGTINAKGTPREVAKLLYSTNDPMAAALPAPVRIFYGVETGEAAQGSTPAAASLHQCPLTVRDGRIWLTERERAHPPARKALPDEGLPPREAAGCPALELRDVWFRYDRELPDVLCGVNLTVAEGTTFALMGGNGTGKSTLLKCTCGLLKPYRGKVCVLGQNVQRYPGDSLYRNGIAMLPQDPQNLFVKQTVREDLAEMLPASSADTAEREHRLLAVAETCAITELLGAHPFDLSGGEQQRVALAKVLLTDPRLLLLDEPTKGLDSASKQKLALILAKLKAKGVAIMLVSHDVEFCAHHADSVALLFDGTIVTTGTPRTFFAQSSFYTTAANRMSRRVFANAVTDEDVIELCLSR